MCIHVTNSNLNQWWPSSIIHVCIIRPSWLKNVAKLVQIMVSFWEGIKQLSYPKPKILGIVWFSVKTIVHRLPYVNVLVFSTSSQCEPTLSFNYISARVYVYHSYLLGASLKRPGLGGTKCHVSDACMHDDDDDDDDDDAYALLCWCYIIFAWYWCLCLSIPRLQGSWGQHGAHLGPVGPRWAPCWSHKPCFQGIVFSVSHFTPLQPLWKCLPFI